MFTFAAKSRDDHADSWAVELRSGRAGSESSNIIKAFTSALFETYQNLENSNIAVLSIATVDVLGMCLYASPRSKVGDIVFISAWALALSVQLQWAIQSLDTWNGQQTIPRFFLCPGRNDRLS